MGISKRRILSLMPRLFAQTSAVLALVGLASLCACNGGTKGPTTVEVTGIVTMDGTPIEGANVVFSPSGGDDSRLASQATTDSAGRYRLRTHIGGGKFKSGIEPGKYDVAINKLDTAAIKTTYAPPKNLLPAKYADAKTSQLKAEGVEGRENDFPFALKKE
jgi:hypothetical protein